MIQSYENVKRDREAFMGQLEKQGAKALPARLAGAVINHFTGRMPNNAASALGLDGNPVFKKLLEETSEMFEGSIPHDIEVDQLLAKIRHTDSFQQLTGE